MFSRIAFLVIAIFWVTMNVLLWRSEYGGGNRFGSVVPLEVVWQKILTAPDNSSMEITHRGEKIGYCRWSATVQEPVAPKTDTDEPPPEGMVEILSGYRIDFEGNIGLSDFANRLRFDSNIKLTTNHVWKEFSLRLNLRPSSWEIRSQASEQAIHFKSEDDEGKKEKVLKFADLQNPELLAREFDLPLPVQLLGSFGLTGNAKNTAPLSLGLAWEARNDWITIGHTSVRAYRLKAKVLDRFPIVIMVSRVGEILRVELPDDWVLVNDQLTTL
ncbi:MAG: hypothetical protein JWQ71_4365 [Pedosphaera sp.]|nr:hypothetical protein [Pedosphaera sp.]